jgi:hypothetical protein
MVLCHFKKLIEYEKKNVRWCPSAGRFVIEKWAGQANENKQSTPEEIIHSSIVTFHLFIRKIMLIVDLSSDVLISVLIKYVTLYELARTDIAFCNKIMRPLLTSLIKIQIQNEENRNEFCHSIRLRVPLLKLDTARFTILIDKMKGDLQVMIGYFQCVFEYYREFTQSLSVICKETMLEDFLIPLRFTKSAFCKTFLFWSKAFCLQYSLDKSTDCDVYYLGECRVSETGMNTIPEGEGHLVIYKCNTIILWTGVEHYKLYLMRPKFNALCKSSPEYSYRGSFCDGKKQGRGVLVQGQIIHTGYWKEDRRNQWCIMEIE